MLCGCGKDFASGSVAPVEASGSVAPVEDKEAGTNVHVYSTGFAKDEYPLTENGKWVGGSSAGNSLWTSKSFWLGRSLWGDVQSHSGLASGISEPTEFGDPTAILAGAWGPVQTVVATVKVNKTAAVKCCHEVELRLRTTISKNSITGYEAYCSVLPTEQYCKIARWNGPNGNYWNIAETDGTLAMDGDELKATATGLNPTVITFYKNGEKILQAVDSGKAGGGFGAFGPWITGNPGVGFYDNLDNGLSSFGFSSFSATDAVQDANTQTQASK